VATGFYQRHPRTIRGQLGVALLRLALDVHGDVEPPPGVSTGVPVEPRLEHAGVLDESGP
jgi:hypothetical protein